MLPPDETRSTEELYDLTRMLAPLPRLLLVLERFDETNGAANVGGVAASSVDDPGNGGGGGGGLGEFQPESELNPARGVPSGETVASDNIKFFI